MNRGVLTEDRGVLLGRTRLHATRSKIFADAHGVSYGIGAMGGGTTMTALVLRVKSVR